MTPEREIALPEVPASFVDEHGHPRFGTWRGELNEVALERLRGPYQLPRPLRLLRRKRWSYVQVVTPEVIAVLATADLGYTANAFVAVLDRSRREVLYDDGFLGLPGTRVEVGDHPGEGLHASFRRPGTRLRVARGRGNHRMEIDVTLGSPLPLVDGATRALGLDARSVPRLAGEGVLARGARALGLDGGLRWSGALSTAAAAPALTVISPVEGSGRVNVTQKRCGLRAEGTLRVGQRAWMLDGGVAGHDYTQGYLGRRTAWRWAMANGRLEDGTLVGLNLVEGFNAHHDHCNENALWVGERLLPLGRARFHFDRRAPQLPWELETEDGVVTLRFQPLHLHREERDLKLVRSHFVQPLGVFSGTIRVDGRIHRVEDLGGVTEDQDTLW